MRAIPSAEPPMRGTSSEPDLGPVSFQTLDAAHLKAVAGVHVAAFPHSALSALGADLVARYYAWRLRSTEDAVIVGASTGGRLVGFVCAGTFRGSVAGFLARQLPLVVRGVARRPSLALNASFLRRVARNSRALVTNPLHRREPSQRHADTDPHPAYRVLAVATAPEAQSRGIATELLAIVERRANDAGVLSIGLTVEPGNQRAITLYERLGWGRELLGGEWRGGMWKRL
jgi:ribosomal protein S18 acetylase RimI-like enzyme